MFRVWSCEQFFRISNLATALFVLSRFGVRVKEIQRTMEPTDTSTCIPVSVSRRLSGGLMVDFYNL